MKEIHCFAPQSRQTDMLFLAIDHLYWILQIQQTEHFNGRKFFSSRILQIQFCSSCFQIKKFKAGFLESCYLIKVKSCTCLEESWRYGLYPICSSTSGLTSYWRNSEADLRGSTTSTELGHNWLIKRFLHPSRLFLSFIRILCRWIAATSWLWLVQCWPE